MTDQVVQRLYRMLVDRLSEIGHPPDEPVLVSDLYQTLVPYQAVRSALGVELNADYQHALLRLLSGEGDMLRLEPEEARAELQREVESPYPAVDLFRKFAASTVWVRDDADSRAVEPDQSEESAPEASGAGPDHAPVRPPLQLHRPERDDQPVSVDPEAPEPLQPPEDPAYPTDGPDGADERGRTDRAAGSEAAGRLELGEAAGRVRESMSACAFCDEILPVERSLRFCPHCGRDQRLRPCPRCDTPLEAEWRYCIRCGTEVGTD